MILTKTHLVYLRCMAKRFFYEVQHKKNCEVRAKEDEGFETLVRLCLTSDSALIGGESYK